MSFLISNYTSQQLLPPHSIPPMYKTTSRLLSHAYHAFAISHLTPRRLFSVASADASSGALGSKFGSFMEFVREVVKRGPSGYDCVAIRAENKSYTYAQIMSSAWNVSKLLCDFEENERNGVLDSVLGKENGGRWCLNGARIGILAKPSAEFVAGMLGTWLGGGVAVPLALSYPEAELLHVMNDSEVSVLLSTEEHQEIMKNIAAKCSAQFSLIPDVTSNMLKTSSHDLSTVLEQFSPELKSEGGTDSIRKEGDRPALIVYTSGTTGKPKGVVHTHKSITSQVQILTEAWGYSSSDGFLHCLPLHHVHGLFNVLLAPLYAGSMVEFMPKFSVRGVWQRWRESYPEDGRSTTDAITVFSGVPTMYTWLIQGYELMDSELQSTSSAAARKLRLMMCGSSALPLPIMKRWESITGHSLLERYGMTEFVMALANPLQGDRKGGTVGKPLPLVEAKILQEEENCEDINKVGELCIKSPSLFKEYWKRPEVTRESFTDCGFFKTGDTVKMDADGYYIILGRTSADIMKVGGYKLSALEIESVLLEHPAISECTVLGLPDKDYGEAVCAIIVPQASSVNGAEQDQQSVSSKEFNAGTEPEYLLALSLDELRTWSKNKLAPYKIPTKLFVWDKLPRNAMGKVNKKELKKLLP